LSVEREEQRTLRYFLPKDTPLFADYRYDANGNLAHDPFKNLAITYNHLNLPDTEYHNEKIQAIYHPVGCAVQAAMLYIQI
jgi:hypothetical protein